MGWGGVKFNSSSSSFSLNYSKTLKAVNLKLDNTQLNFIRDIHFKFGIHNSLQSPDIGKNSGNGISDFRVSGQSSIKENCHNYRTSDDIDMKIKPVIKIVKRNKITSKKLTIASCLKTVTSLSVFGFLANLEQSGCRIPNTESGKVMFSVIVTLCLTKTETTYGYVLTRQI